jgi:hypothetical protein
MKIATSLTLILSLTSCKLLPHNDQNQWAWPLLCPDISVTLGGMVPSPTEVSPAIKLSLAGALDTKKIPA